MSASVPVQVCTSGGQATALSPSKLAILLPYALVLWSIAWCLIRFRGPHGAFEGYWGITVYVVTVPATVMLNWLHLKLTGLPKTEIVNCVAITLAAATTIDGICLSFFPNVYGNDPNVLREGGAYIIWAGAVACWLAFGTLHSAQRNSRASGFKGPARSVESSEKTAARHSLLDLGGLSVAAMVAFVFWLPTTVLANRAGDKLQTLTPNIEIKSLALCCILALSLSVVQVVSHILNFGGPAVRGNRQDYPVPAGFPGRIVRAHANLLESLLPFGIAVFAARALGVSDSWTAAAALMFAFARIVHAATYLAGLTVIRSAAFYAGLIATVQMFWAALI